MNTVHTKPNYFGRWAAARAKVAKIQEHLRSGGVVQVTTYTKSWLYDARHAEWFSATSAGAFVKQGKQTVCFDHAGLRFGRVSK